MSYQKKLTDEESVANRDDQSLLPTQWAPPPHSIYTTNGDMSPMHGMYYTNIKTPDGSLFSKR